MRFSERYGYEKPPVVIRETLTPDIKNSIITFYDNLQVSLELQYGAFYDLSMHLWTEFFDKRKRDFKNGEEIIINFIESSEVTWYKKLNILEETIQYFYNSYDDVSFLKPSIYKLNNDFKRLNFAYRIIDGVVAEITSEQEIKAIETAIAENKFNIALHLNEALKKYSDKENPDYRNSIKESISAVEALNREITRENALNFKKMEKEGLKVPSVLLEAFKKLYGYTNDSKTGIRHSLMDSSGEYVPGAEEALYMLVTCSAFINYLNSKLKSK